MSSKGRRTDRSEQQPNPSQQLAQLLGTTDPSEQFERTQYLAGAPVFAVTVLWDGRFRKVIGVSATQRLEDIDILNIIGDAQKHVTSHMAAKAMREAEEKAKASSSSPEAEAATSAAAHASADLGSEISRDDQLVADRVADPVAEAVQA